jgi:hypothetical protein
LPAKGSAEILLTLENNYFTKSNGLTSMIVLNFTADNQYSMRVMVVEYGEVVNVRGTYQVIPKGESEGQVILTPGPVQKSTGYNRLESFDVDNFVFSNTNFTLRKFISSDVEKMAKDNIFEAQNYADEKKWPTYILDGSVVFYSNKKLTQAEKDSIDNAERIKAEKAKDLEEKLKGL